MVAQAFNPSRLITVSSRLACSISSRTARDILRNPVSKTSKTKQKKDLFSVYGYFAYMFVYHISVITVETRRGPQIPKN